MRAALLSVMFSVCVCSWPALQLEKVVDEVLYYIRGEMRLLKAKFLLVAPAEGTEE